MKITRDVLEQLILEEFANMDEAEEGPAAALKKTGVGIAKGATRLAPDEASMLNGLLSDLMRVALQPGDISKHHKVKVFAEKLRTAIGALAGEGGDEAPGPAAMAKKPTPQATPGPGTPAKGPAPGPPTPTPGAGPTRRPRE